MQTKYLVIGINAAGFSALEELRKFDSESSIIAVNGEPYLPYKRTKINKNFFPPDLDAEKFQLAEPSWYSNNKIELLNKSKVVAIDPILKTAVLDSKEIIYWEKLLLSTGAESYDLDNPVFRGALKIRSFEDAKRVEGLINKSESCLIYGLGIEAIETAAQLKDAGISVTLAGRGSVLLSRYFSTEISTMVEHLCNINNVPVLFNTSPGSIGEIPKADFSDLIGEITGYYLKGSDKKFDFLLYSLGINPNKQLAGLSGIDVDKGILVSSKMETSSANIYAAGDCAQRESSSITDHWHSAQDQGRTAAANMTGLSVKWPVKKYRLKMEIFGNYFFSMKPKIVYDNVDIEKSVLTSGAFRLFYYGDNKLQAVEMVNDKTRAKLYEKAVNEAWSKSKVKENLS